MVDVSSVPIEVQHWFSTPIWYTKLTEIENKKVKKYCKKLKKQSAGRVLSNVGGWQSEDVSIRNCDEPETKKLMNSIFIKLENIVEGLSLVGYKLDIDSLQCWININGEGNYNIQHNHPRAFLSGVYYVKVSENGPNISFHHPNTLQKFWWQEYGRSSGSGPESFACIEYFPEPGKLIIFPPWLEHSVGPNMNKSKRISIAFNINLKKS